MARIGVAGFLHETNTFANDITTFAHFAQADAWPGLLTGPSLLSETQGMNLAVSGFIYAIDKSRHSLVPLLWCSAKPSGPEEQGAFDAILLDSDKMLRHHGTADSTESRR